MQVIYNFTSQYVSFLVTSESLAGTLNLIITIINESNSSDSSNLDYPKIYNKNSWILFIEILSLIFIIFGTLIYNEMIVIRKWGLDENTKKALYIKGMKDFFITFKEYEDNEDGDMDDELLNNDDNDDDKKKNDNDYKVIELKSS